MHPWGPSIVSRKKIIIFLALAVILVGGFFAVKQYLDTKAHEAYIASSDYVADQLIETLRTGDYGKAYSDLFSDRMKQNYAVDYWKDQVFPVVKGTADSPRLISKKPANQADPAAPSPYPQGSNAQQYIYDYRVNNMTYRLTFVLADSAGTWRVNEFDGAFQL